MTEFKSELYKLKKLIREECERIRIAENAIDAAMQGPSTEQRGQKIGRAMTEITMARHSLLHFGLDVPLNKLK